MGCRRSGGILIMDEDECEENEVLWVNGWMDWGNVIGILVLEVLTTYGCVKRVADPDGEGCSV